MLGLAIMVSQLGMMVPGHTKRAAVLCSCVWLQMYLFGHFFFFFRASYIEIYNEKIYDLFEKGKTDLKLREVKGTVTICGVKEEVVRTPDKVKIRLSRVKKFMVVDMHYMYI
jgi:hypothetical protein